MAVRAELQRQRCIQQLWGARLAHSAGQPPLHKAQNTIHPASDRLGLRDLR